MRYNSLSLVKRFISIWLMILVETQIYRTTLRSGLKKSPSEECAGVDKIQIQIGSSCCSFIFSVKSHPVLRSPYLLCSQLNYITRLPQENGGFTKSILSLSKAALKMLFICVIFAAFSSCWLCRNGSESNNSKMRYFRGQPSL